MVHRQHRTEDLGPRHFALERQPFENRRPHEVAGPILRNVGIATVDHRPRAVADRLIDQRLDARSAFRRDHRAHLHAVVEPVAGDASRGPLLDRVAEGAGRLSHGDRERRREAALAGAAERAVGDDFRRRRHVGVGHDDHRVLRATLALDALAGGRAARVDVTRRRARTDEADRADDRMVEDRVDHVAAAVDQVHDPGRQLAGYPAT